MLNHEVNANLAAPNARIAIVVARFNEFVNNSLVDGAIDTLQRIGLVKKENIDIIKVPGAYEIPFIVKQLTSKKYDGIVALGTVIRGGTAHFEYVSGPLASNLMKVSLDSGVPVGFGVLTVESIEQAIERAGTKMGNKGAEAAETVLELVNLQQHISKLS